MVVPRLVTWKLALKAGLLAWQLQRAQSGMRTQLLAQNVPWSPLGGRPEERPESSSSSLRWRDYRSTNAASMQLQQVLKRSCLGRCLFNAAARAPWLSRITPPWLSAPWPSRTPPPWLSGQWAGDSTCVWARLPPSILCIDRCHHTGCPPPGPQLSAPWPSRFPAPWLSGP